MGYGIELRDESGAAILPGYYAPPRYKSALPMPIPLVGDHILEYGARWKVMARDFYYNVSEEHDDDREFHETHCSVMLTCRKILDGVSQPCP